MSPATLPQEARKLLDTLASIHTLVATVPAPQATEEKEQNPAQVETLRRRLAIATSLAR